MTSVINILIESFNGVLYEKDMSNLITLTEIELDALSTEIDLLENHIDNAEDDQNIEFYVHRLDEIIQLIEQSKENICTHQQVIQLF